MKKSLVILLVALVAISLFVGCKKEPEAKPTKSYKVSFDANGGTGSILSQKVKEGEKATMPTTIPTHTGWGFLGWSTDKDGTTAFDFAEETISADTTLYAMWKKSYSVGETGPAGGTIFYDAGSEQTTTYKDSNGNDVTYTWRYLEVAPVSDVSEAVFGDCKNESGAEIQVVTTGNDAIGAGHSNTRAIVNAMEASATGAAKICDSYKRTQYGVEYNDWFLPSVGEFEKLDAVKNQVSGLMDHMDYWTSTEKTDVSAYYYRVWQDKSLFGSKSLSEYVLPIRAF